MAETKPIFFWNADGTTYAFLSQWYPSPFHATSPSPLFRTAEHYMMHQKALMFHDPSTASAILDAVHPSSAKALGRDVKNFSSTRWNRYRERVVLEGSYYKFLHGVEEGTGRPLKELLLETGTRELVEASPEDRIWGIGFGAEEAEKSTRAEWGLNLLGKALMKARGLLRAGEDLGQRSDDGVLED